MMRLRLVSRIYAENLDGGRYLFEDEIARFLEVYRNELAGLWRRFRQRETNEIAAQIAKLEADIEFWKGAKRE